MIKKISKIITVSSILLFNPQISAYEIEDNSLVTRLISAEHAMANRDYQTARTIYQQLNSETNSASIAEQLTYLNISTKKNHKLALESARKWASLDDENLNAKAICIYLSLSTNSKELAVNYIQNLLNTNMPAAGEHLVGVYFELANVKQKNSMLSILESIENERPQDTNLLFTLSQIYIEQKSYNLAALSLKQITNIDNTNFYAYSTQTKLLIALEEKQKAKFILKNMLENNPKNNKMYSFYLDTIYGLYSKNELKTHLQNEYKNIKIHSQEKLILLAKHALKSKLHTFADKFITLAREKNNGHRAYFLTALIAEKSNNPNKAIEYYSLVPRGSNYIQARINLANLLAKEQQATQAINILNNINTSKLENVKEIYLAKAKILYKNNKKEESLAELTDSTHTFYKDTELLYLKSIVALKCGKYLSAINDLKSILEKKPKDADALNALGYIHTNYTQDYTLAKKYLDLANKLSPENADIIDSIAWLHFKTGNSNKAILLLKKALNLKADGAIAAHLGEVLYHSGRIRDAKNVWNTALEVFPDNDDLLETMDKYNLLNEA